ncbi:MAG: glycosyltransferase [Anaerolineaceae bacterium]|nr:glycosyltransferase [Anaerolineaceae bacterium]
MRKGQNPAKFVDSVAKPSSITVAVLNYIPYLSGFYSDSLQVLKTCLKSISNETKLDYDLLVFDNGSCREVQSFLFEEKINGNIQFLILSDKNLGKGGAWNIMFTASPGNIISYADSDIFFHKDWLTKSIQILDSFPNVGMVTARPYVTDQEFLTNTLQWAKENHKVKLTSGKLLPWEVFSDFLLSLGRTLEEIKLEYDSNDMFLLKYQDFLAYAGASHWQFTTKKSIIQKFLPFEMNRPMGQVNLLDDRMNKLGFLRLMTHEVLADNLSNSLDKNSFDLVNNKVDSKKTIHRILDIPIIKSVLLFLHHRIFLAYYNR